MDVAFVVVETGSQVAVAVVVVSHIVVAVAVVMIGSK